MIIPTEMTMKMLFTTMKRSTNQDTESDDDYSEVKDHEEVNKTSNNEEEGKWDANDNKMDRIYKTMIQSNSSLLKRQIKKVKTNIHS